MAALHNRPLAFLDNLEHLDAHGQYDAFVNEVLETCGQFTPPRGDTSHCWQLCLHGICADGATDEEAMANWKRLARRAPEIIEADGFTTIHPPANQIGAA